MKSTPGVHYNKLWSSNYQYFSVISNAQFVKQIATKWQFKFQFSNCDYQYLFMKLTPDPENFRVNIMYPLMLTSTSQQAKEIGFCSCSCLISADQIIICHRSQSVEDVYLSQLSLFEKNISQFYLVRFILFYDWIKMFHKF